MVGGLEPEDREDVFYFLRDLGIPVVADVNSGIRELLQDLFSSRKEFCREFAWKNFTIRRSSGREDYGGILNQILRPKSFRFAGTVFRGLARESQVIQGNVGRVIRGLGEVDFIGDVRDDFPSGRPIFSNIDERLESFPDSEPGLVNLLSVYATTGESLFIGNSLPIREWNEYGQRETPYARVFANRGANGIDGQLSSWLGATAETPDSWGVFGDLTTLYDLAAPGHVFSSRMSGACYCRN
jgi:2-succinyl-5-enolpyruvyl-6-hydroxy-3-cyclohexene-1-carboxylate synthase